MPINLLFANLTNISNETFFKSKSSILKKSKTYLFACFFLSNFTYGAGQYIVNNEVISFPVVKLSTCNGWGTVTMKNISLVILSRTSAKLTATLSASGLTFETTYSDTYASLNGNKFEFEARSLTNCAESGVSGTIHANFVLNGPLTSNSVSGVLTFAVSGTNSGSGNKTITLNFQGDNTPSLSISGTNNNVVCNTETISISVGGDSPSNTTIWANGVQIATAISNNNFSFSTFLSYPYSIPDVDNQSILIESRNARGNSSIIIQVAAPLPSNMTVTANKVLPLCNVEPLTLSINNPANSTVSWPDGGATISNPTTKEYRAIVQKRLNGVNVCPSVTKNINVEVFTFNPTINAPAQTAKCQGEAIDLTVNPNGSGSFSYAWTKSDGTPVGNSQTIQARDPGQYRVEVKPSVNCPSKQTSTSFSLHFETPIADGEIQSSNANNIICGAPDASTIVLTAAQDNVNYQWEGPGVSTPNSKSITVGQGGRYVVNMNRNGLCFRQKAIDIRDNNYDQNIASVPDAYCADSPLTLRANTDDGGRFDYVWKRDGNNIGGNSPSLTLTPNETGAWTFTVEIQSKGTGCSPKTSQPKRITSHEPIKDDGILLPSNKTRPIICGAPQEPSIVLTAVQDNVSYSWEGPGISNATNKTLTISQPGRYAVSMHRGACFRQKEIHIELNAYDQNIASAPEAFCSDAPITLTANSNDPDRFDYKWKRDNADIGTNAPTLTLPNELGTFKYKVEITAKGTGCEAKISSEVAIRVDRAITGQKITLPPNKTRAIICGAPETSIDLTAVSDSPTNDITYQWQGPAVTAVDAIAKASQAGDYKVIFNRGVCRKEATVQVESGFFVPNISATGTVISPPTDIRICRGESSLITAAIEGTPIPNNTDNFTYKWFGGGESNTELTNQKENTLQVTTPGVYRLEVTLTGSGCAEKKTAQSIKIAVDPPFKNVKITPNPAIICNKATGLEIAVLSDSSAGTTYQWSGGGKSNNDPSKYIVTNEGTYSVNLTRGACYAQASVSPREEELKVNVTPPNTSKPIIVCSGDNGIPMVLQATSNLSTAVITWKRDGSDAPSTNSGNSYTPSQTGRYFATANFNNICLATSPDTIAIEALSNFAVNITPTNPPALCDDRPILLTAQLSEPRYIGLYKYEWKQDTRTVKMDEGLKANTLTTGKVVNYDGNTLVLGNESRYIVSILKDGCKATSPPNKLTLKPARSSIAVLDYNTLEASESSDGKYEWYYKAGSISSLADSTGYTLETGTTSRIFLGAKPGAYMVRANRNGCGTKYSFAYHVDVTTAASPMLNDDWKVYPNPISTALTIENKAHTTSATIELWSESGQQLERFSQQQARESYQVSHLPVGVYYLKIKDGKQTVTQKIIKQ